MEDATGAEAVLGGPVPITDLAQEVLVGDADLVVADLAVIRLGAAPDADAALDDHARVRRRHNDLDHPPWSVVLIGLLGPAHDDEEVGGQTVGGEPLVPVDHPLVPFADGGGLNGSRVRACVLGLRHGEARLHGPLNEGEQPLLLLLLGPVLDQNGLIARVRGHDAEQRCRPYGVGEDFVHVGVCHEIDTHAAVLGRQVGCPQPLRLDFRLDLAAQRPGLRPLGRGRVAPPRVPEHGLVGQDLLVDDPGRTQADVVDFVAERFVGRDVDGHEPVPPLRSLFRTEP